MKPYLIAVGAGLLSIAPFIAQAQDRTYEVLFALDSSRLDASANQILDQAAQAYDNGETASVMVQGHTDTSASASYNQALSERRAISVRTGLTSRGIPAAVMDVSGVGENDLAIQTGDGVVEQANRRVTIGMTATPEPAPAPVAAPAPAPEPRKRVAFSLAPFGSYNNQTGNDSYFAGANLTASYFVTPNIAASAEQALFYEFEGQDDGFGGRTVIGADFHFDAGGVLPYVGANVGRIYTDGSFGSDWIYGPEIGVKFGVFSMKVAYDIPFDRDWDDGNPALTVGAGFLF